MIKHLKYPISVFTQPVLALSFVAAIILTMIPTSVYAHDGVNVAEYGSFLVGLLHPILGLDHLLAMLSVGIVSSQIGGRAIWMIPAAFVGMMLVGGLMGFAEIPMVSLELGIALSVVLLGILIAFNWPLSIMMAMVAVGIFAIFHGYAHGAEMPELAEPGIYIGGFLVGTTIIHLIGVLIGDIPRHYQRSRLAFQILGVAIASCGLLFIVGVL